tara:strand:+ start:780 stop:1352 length:573 start_codon:yes stop_codon:yes gene_type:complete
MNNKRETQRNAKKRKETQYNMEYGFVVPTSIGGKDSTSLVKSIRNMPENIKMDIYMFSRPRTTSIAKTQIKNNALAYRTITYLKYVEISWLDELEAELLTDIPGPSWCDHLNEVIPLERMPEILDDLSKCQCCKRHHGIQSYEEMVIVGTPVNPGYGWATNIGGVINPVPTCICPCRHYRRWIKHIIDNV